MKIVVAFIAALAMNVTILGAGTPVPSATPDPNCLPDSLCPDWVARYDGAVLSDRAVGAVASPDGSRIYVTGISSSSSNGLDVATVAYDATNGTQIWATRYNGPANANDQPFYFGTGKQIAISNDGSTIFIVGLSAQNSGNYPNDYLTIAYRTSDGSQLWARRYSVAGDSNGSSLALSNDGKRLYVTGYSALGQAAPPAPPADNYDFTTIAYDVATGDQIWLARYEGPASFWDIAYDVAVANVAQADGTRREQVFVTGRSNGASSDNNEADFATVAYDGLTGSELWVARYNANGRDLAYGVATSPDGSLVCVTGESAGVAADYATICYDTLTGAQRWIARYDNGDLDEPLDITFSPSGDRVAVTGFSADPPVGIPLRSPATIVYDAATGAEVWVARHSEIDGAAASHVAFSHDGRRLYISGLENGNVFVVGPAQAGHSPALTAAYDATDGAELWATHYSGPAGDEGNFDMVVSPDDAHVYATGGGQSQAADFATLSFTTGAPTPPPLQLSNAKSRKVHGSVGTFDIDLPLSGRPGIECRSGGDNGEYTVVFGFVNPVTSVATAKITSGTGSVASSTIDSDDRKNYIVNVTGVTNAQVITVTLTNVYDSAGNAAPTISASMGVLLGDVNGTGRTDSGDVTAARNHTVSIPDQETFRFDVNTSGRIDSGDVTATRNATVTVLP